VKLAGCERNAAHTATLVDIDLWGKFSSSELNGGGVRCTFAEPINVKLSLASTRPERTESD
jgi:hypothetical protein